jgi:hypothetical protein
MAFQGLTRPHDTLLGTRKGLSEKHLSCHPNLSAEGFGIWWNRTEALQAAVVAEASALMRAHRRVRPTDEARFGQTH